MKSIHLAAAALLAVTAHAQEPGSLAAARKGFTTKLTKQEKDDEELSS